MKKIYRVLFLALLAVILTACRKKPSEALGKLQIYYTNSERSALTTEGYNPSQTEGEALIDEILQKLQNPAGMTENISLLPTGVEIRSYTLTDGQLTLVFSESYRQLENVSEVLLRAGLVKTLTQSKDVRTVVFHIGDDVLCDKNGEPIGAMTSSMFINNPVGINSYQYASLSLYFASRLGDKVVKEMRNVHYSSNTTLEKVVMEQLQIGPMNKQLHDILPSDVRIINITRDKKTCTLNLSQEMLQGPIQGITPEAEIYSIVNSLCDILGVEQVQFQVEGESDVMFADSLSFNGPFHRNSSIIEAVQTMDKINGTEAATEDIAEPSVGV